MPEEAITEYRNNQSNWSQKDFIRNNYKTSTDKDFLTRALEYTKDPMVADWILNNPNCPEEAKEKYLQNNQV